MAWHNKFQMKAHLAPLKPVNPVNIRSVTCATGRSLFQCCRSGLHESSRQILLRRQKFRANDNQVADNIPRNASSQLALLTAKRPSLGLMSLRFANNKSLYMALVSGQNEFYRLTLPGESWER